MWAAISKAGSYISDQDSTRFEMELQQESGEDTSKMAMAIIFKALLLQEMVAQHHENVPAVSQMLDDPSGGVTKGNVLKAWQEVLKINYEPIFTIAE